MKEEENAPEFPNFKEVYGLTIERDAKTYAVDSLLKNTSKGGLYQRETPAGIKPENLFFIDYINNVYNRLLSQYDTFAARLDALQDEVDEDLIARAESRADRARGMVETEFIPQLEREITAVRKRGVAEKATKIYIIFKALSDVGNRQIEEIKRMDQSIRSKKKDLTNAERSSINRTNNRNLSATVTALKNELKKLMRRRAKLSEGLIPIQSALREMMTLTEKIRSNLDNNVYSISSSTSRKEFLEIVSKVIEHMKRYYKAKLESLISSNNDIAHGVSGRAASLAHIEDVVPDIKNYLRGGSIFVLYISSTNPITRVKTVNLYDILTGKIHKDWLSKKTMDAVKIGQSKIVVTERSLLNNWYFSAKPTRSNTAETRREYRKILMGRFEEQSTGRMSEKPMMGSDTIKSYRADVVNAILLSRNVTECPAAGCPTKDSCHNPANAEECIHLATLEQIVDVLRTVKREYGKNNRANNNRETLLNIAAEGGAKKRRTTKKPTTKKSTTKKSTAKKPTKKPTTKKSTAKKPTTKKSTAKKPTTKKSTAKKPTTKKPTTKKPTKKTTKKPTTKKTTTKKPTKKAEVSSKVLKGLLTRVGL